MAKFWCYLLCDHPEERGPGHGHLPNLPAHCLPLQALTLARGQLGQCLLGPSLLLPPSPCLLLTQQQHPPQLIHHPGLAISKATHLRGCSSNELC